MSVSRRGTRVPRAPEYAAVKAGVLENATYPEQTLIDVKHGTEYRDPRAGMHVATIAAALEYGGGQNHPRPFMQTTVAEKKDGWVNALIILLTPTGETQLERDLFPVKPEEALATIGQIMKEDIQETIRNWPADNSDNWAAIKGFNKGLIQTSHLLNSIEFALIEKDES